LLALLLFSPPIYLPILLAHVPGHGQPGRAGSSTARPSRARTFLQGALKATRSRFLLPLYALLFALAWRVRRNR
jgi:hypothetical protein